MGSGARGGAGAGVEAGGVGKHHSGLLSEADESRSRTRSAKVCRWAIFLLVRRVCTRLGFIRYPLSSRQRSIDRNYRRLVEPTTRGS